MNQRKKDKERYFSHIITNQFWYLLILMFIVLSIPLISNLINNNPVIMGGESYYHLNEARNLSWKNFPYIGLQIIEARFYDLGFILIPFSLAVISLFIFFGLAKKIQLSKKFTFFFLFFFLLSPTFIFAYSTLSSYSFFIFLFLSGFLLLYQQKKSLRCLAFIPFVASTFIDQFSTIIIILSLLFYMFKTKRSKNRSIHLLLATIVIFFFFNLLVFKQPFVLGPFYQEQIFIDFLSDLGGLSGISSFVFILSLIGIAVSWKIKKINLFYILLPLTMSSYIYTTKTTFLLSISLIFFATAGFLTLLERQWTLKTLKMFTLLLLILGISFSSFTYLDRLTPLAPSAEERGALIWIQENSNNQAIVYSTPENEPFIKYFAQREAFSTFQSKEKKNVSNRILTANYIHELFPLLEDNNISLLYFTSKIKSMLPKDQDLLFLLKNERFKLLYSHGETEVWEFTNKKENIQ